MSKQELLITLTNGVEIFSPSICSLPGPSKVVGHYDDKDDIDKKKVLSRNKAQKDEDCCQDHVCEQSDVKPTTDKAFPDHGHAEKPQQNQGSFQNQGDKDNLDKTVQKFDEPQSVNAARAYKLPPFKVKKAGILWISLAIILLIIGGTDARAAYPRAITPVFCGPGEKYNPIENRCYECDKDTWSSKSYHRDVTCSPCSDKRDHQHSVEVKPCTPTQDTVLNCSTGYVDIAQAYRILNCEKSGPNTTPVTNTSTTAMINGSIADEPINKTSTSPNVTLPSHEEPIDDGKGAFDLRWLILIVPAIICLLVVIVILRWCACRHRIRQQSARISSRNDHNEASTAILLENEQIVSLKGKELDRQVTLTFYHFSPPKSTRL